MVVSGATPTASGGLWLGSPPKSLMANPLGPLNPLLGALRENGLLG